MSSEYGLAAEMVQIIASDICVIYMTSLELLLNVVKFAESAENVCLWSVHRFVCGF